MENKEQEELLWDPETGGENIALPKETDVKEEPKEVNFFEIPDLSELSTIIPEPELSEELVQEPEKDPVTSVKEAKRRYKEEKKRLKKEMRKLGVRRGTVWVLTILFFLFGCVLGAGIAYFILT